MITTTIKSSKPRIIKGIPTRRTLLHHYRVDHAHSNAYELWKQMGEPQDLTPNQYARLEKKGQLELIDSPKWVTLRDGSLSLPFELPRQGVSLLKLSWGQ